LSTSTEGCRNIPSKAIVGVEVAITRKESSMIKPILAASSVVLAVAGSPAVGQQSPTPDQSAAQKVDPSLVGLSVYSSDGQKVGQVSEVGLSGGVPAVRADMGEFLGMSPGSVIIGGQAFERKPDRIEVAMTAQEIKDTVSKQQEEREKK
jgi:PRC-barrel domain protein